MIADETLQYQKLSAFKQSMPRISAKAVFVQIDWEARTFESIAAIIGNTIAAVFKRQEAFTRMVEDARQIKEIEGKLQASAVAIRLMSQQVAAMQSLINWRMRQAADATKTDAKKARELQTAMETAELQAFRQQNNR